MSNRVLAIKTTAMSLVVSALSAVPVFAQGQDVFSHNTTGTKPASSPSAALPKEKPIMGAMAMMSPRTPVVAWFENFDSSVHSLTPTPADKVLMEKPFNQEAERVQQWTQVASRVAKNYRLLATTLRVMDIPGGNPEIKQYSTLCADWYGDAAGVFDDLIRPRKPAKTIEELTGQLNEIKDRTDTLVKQQKDLHGLDMALRSKYHVHLSREDDALSKYVMGK